MEDLATQTLRTGKRVTGLSRPTVIQPYQGFIADGVAHIRARAMEKPIFDIQPGGLRIDATLAANLLRWVVLDIAGLKVSVTVAGNTVTTHSNADGFIVAKVPVKDIEPGWHEVLFHAEDQGREVTARGRAVLPDSSSKVGFITDIDDTVLVTGMTEGLKATRRTLLRDAYGRQPVPGTPSLYRGLARGTNPKRPESTFFYVSSGPWNLYDMLTQFLGVRGFPRGPIFLTDWRPGSPPNDAEGKIESNHKRARIRRILDAYPKLDFVFIGDSGERDEQIYREFLESDPERIRVAFIRDVATDGFEATGESDSPDQDQPGLIRVRDSIQLAQAAHGLGLIDELTVEEVTAEIDARV